MEEVEVKLWNELEGTHKRLDQLIQKTKTAFEKLTDIYLNQHQNNFVIGNIINKSEFDKRLHQIGKKSEDLHKKLNESKDLLSNKMSNMEKALNKIKRELEAENDKKIAEIDNQKKEIDNDFKKQLKSLSTSYK